MLLANCDGSSSVALLCLLGQKTQVFFIISVNSPPHSHGCHSHQSLLPVTFDLYVHWLTCCLFFLFYTFRLDLNISSNYVFCFFMLVLYTLGAFFPQLPLLFYSSHFSHVIYSSSVCLSLVLLATLFRLTSPSSFTPLVPFCFLTSLGHQSSLCSPYDIIQCRLQPVYGTVQVLVALDSASLDRKRRETVSPPNSASSSSTSSSSKCRSLVSVTTQTPPPAWQIWDLIGSSLLHILCLTLLFVAYSWIELT